jgi:hypothetical protein
VVSAQALQPETRNTGDLFIFLILVGVLRGLI